MIVLPLLLACSGEDGPGAATRHWADYAGLEDAAAWSWRETDAAPADSGDTGAADLATAIRGRHTGDGYVELRLGDPWADAAPLGHLAWDTADGIALASYALGDAAGDAPRVFTRDGAEPGDVSSEDGFRCALSTPTEPRSVYYATFDEIVQFDCEGDDALAGTWVFARGHGLVFVDSGLAAWELIAPI